MKLFPMEFQGYLGECAMHHGIAVKDAEGFHILDEKKWKVRNILLVVTV